MGRVAERSEAGWGASPWSGCIRTERLANPAHHSVDIVPDRLVRDPDRPIAFATEHRIPNPVVVGSGLVSASVHFDHQPLAMADKVEEVAPKGRLPAEMIPLRTQLPEADPKPRFRWRQRFSHLASTGDGFHTPYDCRPVRFCQCVGSPTLARLRLAVPPHFGGGRRQWRLTFPA